MTLALSITFLNVNTTWASRSLFLRLFRNVLFALTEGLVTNGGVGRLKAKNVYEMEIGVAVLGS